MAVEHYTQYSTLRLIRECCHTYCSPILFYFFGGGVLRHPPTKKDLPAPTGSKATPHLPQSPQMLGRTSRQGNRGRGIIRQNSIEGAVGVEGVGQPPPLSIQIKITSRMPGSATIRWPRHPHQAVCSSPYAASQPGPWYPRCGMRDTVPHARPSTQTISGAECYRDGRPQGVPGSMTWWTQQMNCRKIGADWSVASHGPTGPGYSSKVGPPNRISGRGRRVGG